MKSNLNIEKIDDIYNNSMIYLEAEEIGLFLEELLVYTRR